MHVFINTDYIEILIFQYSFKSFIIVFLHFIFKQCKDNEITFNEAQCSEFNLIPYKDSFYEWEHVPTSGINQYLFRANYRNLFSVEVCM
jgi:hypothetical protein